MTPTSTYRVQVRPDFDLITTSAVAGYLAKLGVTHLYSAPLLQAMPGSKHGYDVADHSRVNHELGGEKGLRILVEELRAQGLGLVVDIVPNHCGIRLPEANPAWWDVLRRGSSSPYARWFDIDWCAGRIVVPVLADEPHALDDLRIERGELRYFQHRFPIAPGTHGGSATAVHDEQHYRLESWRRGDTDLNYRRFFAVSDLAALRVEDPEVFSATHKEILRWYAEGDIDGIRIDHPDGLRDPGGYLDRLRQSVPDAWLIVEKILEPGEELPKWPVSGTTGYDALRDVCGLFVDPAAEPAFTALQDSLTGTPAEWPVAARAAKREVATGLLNAELRRLCRLAGDLPDVREALVELLACFGVYRSYLPDGIGHLTEAATEARLLRPELDPVISALLPRLSDPTNELAIRFEQTTGAVMAKGVEDTAFYRWTRFIALNEVGGDPSVFGTAPDDFHDACRRRQDQQPYGMTTLSTHDTKRSEDVRARLAVLSELPDDWAATVRRWTSEVPLADPAVAHLLWQTIVGCWPIEPDRLHAYADKAAREAATATTWADPDAEFEQAMHALIDRVYDDPKLTAEVTAFADRITPYGWSNSLGQRLVQLTMPGVPDVYAGCELWDNSLVDPDNRRPVDFTLRNTMLEQLDGGLVPPVDATGAAKLLLVSRALRLRRDRPELFTGYTPIQASGPAAAHAVAFDRGGAVAVATRLPVGLERLGGWGDTALPVAGGRWVDVLTGAAWRGPAIRLADLLATYPVALLTR